MGWATGSEIAEEVWQSIQPYLKPANEKYVSAAIYKIFDERDADDWEWYLSEEGSLYQTYMKLNEPEEYKKCLKEFES